MKKLITILSSDSDYTITDKVKRALESMGVIQYNPEHKDKMVIIEVIEEQE